VQYDSWKVGKEESIMAELVQIRKKAQLTLPLSVRRKLGIEEGDFMDIHVKDNEIVMRPKKLIDKDQAWFWTKRWQEGEREADEDIKAGRVYEYPDAKTAIAALHEASKKYRADKKERK
jgi:AbrB family looped-hinge helix DNA binding protein